jgi:hypothetical protein
MLTELLVLDIETVPQCVSFSEMDPTWRSLFCEKISKTVPEQIDPAEIYAKKAGILAEFGRIICISTAVFHRTENGSWGLKMKNIASDDEVELLSIFSNLCDKMHQLHPGFQFGGHNVREFDIPYICRRLLINRLPLPPCLRLHDKKPWEVKMFDTMSWWKFGDVKNYVSLHLLANVLGITSSKSDMDGSMVQDVYYKERDLARIVKYCQQDVIVTANIILRFLDQPMLDPGQIQVAEG